MKELLNKVGISDRTSEEILMKLEEKQVEYLERLDNVEDKLRKKQLEIELKEIENAISYIEKMM